MTIGITPKGGGRRSDVILAKRMITDSLLKFLGDSSSEGRLLYDLAVSVGGTDDGGAIHQECQRTRQSIWTTLLDLPSELDGKPLPVETFRSLLGKSVQEELIGGTECSITVYGFDEDKPTMSNPYVLVCGNGPDEVNEVSTRVSGEIERRQQGNYLLQDSSKKRNRPIDAGSERPRKSSRLISCTLTIPLWVMRKCTRDDDLFSKLTGWLRYTYFLFSTSSALSCKDFLKRCRQVKEMSSVHDCSLGFVQRYNSSESKPLTVRITPIGLNLYKNRLNSAIELFEGSIVEFLADSYSEGRLLYEMALRADTSCCKLPITDGIVHRQRGDPTSWTKLLELPHFRDGRKLAPCAKFLTEKVVQEKLLGGTSCSIEVYGFEGQISSLCDPYVLVRGLRRDISAVTKSIEDIMARHQETCSCRFLTRVDGA